MLTNWDPFHELSRMQDALLRHRGSTPEDAFFRPSVDIREDDEAFVVHAEIPGVSPEEIDVDVDKGILTLRGERKLEDEEKREGYHRIERRYGQFSRSFHLPDTVDVDAIDAEMKNGVLTLRLPKSAAQKPRRVAVKNGD